MDKLAFLDELVIMVQTGEIMPEEGSESAKKLLMDIRRIVHESLAEEIYNDVTDTKTAYFAPEYKSWKTFLSDCNGNIDYKVVLEESYTEEELESLWQCSHIMEDMTREQIRDDLFLQMCQLKMMSLVRKNATLVNPQSEKRTLEGIKARIKGLFNILYEG